MDNLINITNDQRRLLREVKMNRENTENNRQTCTASDEPKYETSVVSNGFAACALEPHSGSIESLPVPFASSRSQVMEQRRIEGDCRNNFDEAAADDRTGR